MRVILELSIAIVVVWLLSGKLASSLSFLGL